MFYRHRYSLRVMCEKKRILLGVYVYMLSTKIICCTSYRCMPDLDTLSIVDVYEDIIYFSRMISF
jgi:hypothetical protein